MNHRIVFPGRLGRLGFAQRCLRAITKVLTVGIPLVLLVGCGASLNEGGTAAAQLTSEMPAGAASVTPVAAPSPSAGSLVTTAASDATAAGNATSQAAQDFTKAAKVTNGGSASAYKIGAQDVLDISVFKVPDLSKTVQVADSGTINLPLVGEVPAAGRTAQEVERDLTKRLGDKYLQSPQVTVFVKEYNSQFVTIEGAVKKPGVYPIKGKSSLLQVIATAEGFTEVADSDVVIFRDNNGKRSGAKFNIEAIRNGSQPDPQLLQGDTIVVSNSALAMTYQQFLKVLPLGTFVTLL